MLANPGACTGPGDWPEPGGEELTSYDPTTGTWSLTLQMANYRRQHTATLLNDGRVLVVAGDWPSFTDATEIYDPATSTWVNAGNPT